MRELKLKYIIELLSNVGPQAKRDAEGLVEAQRTIQKALDDSTTKLSAFERLLLRSGGVLGNRTEVQAAYLAQLARRFEVLRSEADKTFAAIDKFGRLSAVLGGVAYAVDRVAQKPMDYSLRLAHMANTAFSDRDAKGRIEGKRTLDAAINAAIKVGGGTRDDAALALNDIISSGAVDRDTAIKMLPMIMRTSTASGAAASDIAGIGIRAMQNMGISLEDLPKALNMAMVAGQEGGFELRDMGKWLPQTMAASKQSGLNGIEGFRSILAAMQTSVITAGSKDEAGNNLVNLLGKINSKDTANDFKKEYKIDLPGELAKARSQGVDSIDAFAQLVNTVAMKDDGFVKLRKELESTTDKGERQKTMESMVDILKGKAIGTVVQDRQALMALVALMNNGAYYRNVKEKTLQDSGAIDTAFSVISEETAFKRQAAGTVLDESVQRSFNALAPMLDLVYDGATKLGREFPALTAAVVTMTAAAVGFAGVVGALSMLGVGGAGARGLTGTLFGAGLGRMGLGLGSAGAWGLRMLGAAAPWSLGIGASLYGLGWLSTSVVEPHLLNRGGVRLSSDAQRRIQSGDLAASGPPRLRFGDGAQTLANPTALDTSFTRPPPASGFRKPPEADWLRITAPGQAAQALSQGSATELRLGEGKLAVDVRVTDERATADARVVKPLPLVKINPGATNPGGY